MGLPEFLYWAELFHYLIGNAENMVLETFDTPQFPAADNHLLQIGLFAEVFGSPFGIEGVAKLTILFAALAGEDRQFGAQAITQSVEPNGGFAQRTSGPGILQCVAAVRCDLPVGSQSISSKTF